MRARRFACVSPAAWPGGGVCCARFGTHVSKSACSWKAGAVRSGSGAAAEDSPRTGLQTGVTNSPFLSTRTSPGGGSSGGGAREPEPSQRPRPSPVAPRPGREGSARARAAGGRRRWQRRRPPRPRSLRSKWSWTRSSSRRADRAPVRGPCRGRSSREARPNPRGRRPPIP